MQNSNAARVMLSFLIAISLGQLINASAFFSRQSGPINVPPACTGNCSELNTILQSCDATSCLCTQLLLDDLASCTICVGQLSGATFDTPQTTLNNLVEECEEAGITLSPILLPGETALPSPPPPSTPQGPQAGGNRPNPNPASAPASASPSTPPGPAPAVIQTTSSAATSTSSSASSDSSSSTPSQSTPAALPTPTQPAQTQSSDSDTSTASNTVQTPSPTATNGSGRVKVTAFAGVMALSGLLLALS